MKLKLRRRDIILIAAFWLIGLALLGLVFYFAVFQSAPPTPSPDQIYPQATFTVVHTQVTAKSLLPQTESQIAMWQQDARLYTVSATWQKTELDTAGAPTIWTYRFYSPGQKRLYFVTVDPDGRVTGTSHGERIYHPPQPIPIENWAVDSSQALNLWLNHGGSAMLTAIPGIQVVAQLQVNSPDAPTAWTVAGYDQLSKHFHTVFINAATGEVLEIKTSLY